MIFGNLTTNHPTKEALVKLSEKSGLLYVEIKDFLLKKG